MKNEDEDIEIYKQKYLVTNVINQGLNPEEFIQFMSSKKRILSTENGHDIANWTMNELIEVT